MIWWGRKNRKDRDDRDDRRDDRDDRKDERHERKEDRREGKIELWRARAGCFKWLAVCAAMTVALVYGFKSGAFLSLFRMIGK